MFFDDDKFFKTSSTCSADDTNSSTLDNKTFATGLCPARNGCLQNGQSPSIFSHELNEAYDDTLHIVAIINKIVMHFGNLIVVIVSQSTLLSIYNMYCVKSLWTTGLDIYNIIIQVAICK